MRYHFVFSMMIILGSLHLLQAGQPRFFASLRPETSIDSILPDGVNKKARAAALPVIPKVKSLTNFPVNEFMLQRVASKGELGFSKKGKAVNAYFFPGTSDKKALVVAGVHGSERAAIAIAEKLLNDLEQSAPLYYNIVVIPCLFPDNEQAAKMPTGAGKKIYNYGRYTSPTSVDPNRQMPALGKAFDNEYPLDYHGRPIEIENQLLLQLIKEYQPDRLLNLHAIRDIKQAGVFADPRTDYQGFAFGYESDSLLAVNMAKYIYEQGGNAAGNHLDDHPTTLYYNDPAIASEGLFQPRNLEGAKLPLARGQGISLGSWGSTAVCDSMLPAGNRAAIRLITVEYPGYKRPQDYTSPNDRAYHTELVGLYTSAILKYFFAPGLEEKKSDPCLCNNKSSQQAFTAVSK